MTAERHTRRYRCIWISDVHLGTRGCRAEVLLDFLDRCESETLYLVGDIVDGWRLKRSWYWPHAHNEVLQKLLHKARTGTRVIYVPGNHDAFARDHAGGSFGAVQVRREDIYEAADGRRYLVTHGDDHDGLARYATGLAEWGGWAYAAALSVGHGLRRVRGRIAPSRGGMATRLKLRVKRAAGYVSAFETAMAALASRRGVDGIVCGHVHHPMIREIGGRLYCNDGDWVQSCTALVEHGDGRLEILAWPPATALPSAPSGQPGRGMVETPALC